MQNMLRIRSVWLFILVLLIVLFNSFDVYAADSYNDSMMVEVNLSGFSEDTPVGGVSIEVPEYINLGSVSRQDPVSDEVSIPINNTGGVPIIVTPMLKTNNDPIYQYLFFRTQKSSTVDPTLAIFKRIGEYNVAIDKPASGKSSRSKSIYMQLNMTDFTGTINENMFGYKKEIVFVAMSQ